MNITQLRDILKKYGCHDEPAKGQGIRIFSPNYGKSEIVPHWEHKQAKDIKDVAERLSGKSLTHAWDSGKGGSVA